MEQPTLPPRKRTGMVGAGPHQRRNRTGLASPLTPQAMGMAADQTATATTAAAIACFCSAS